VGCDGAPASSEFQSRDSAGITISESFGPAWAEGAGWRIGPDPQVRLGVLDGDPALQFDGITGLVRLEDGTIVVADGGAQEVRFFTPDGRLQSTGGGEGEGPGEFTWLSDLGMGSGGSIWAYDFSLRRVTWLDETGAVEGITTLGPEPPILNPVGPLPDGTFLLKQLWGATEIAGANEEGFRRDPVAFVRFAQDGALLDTLGLFPGREVVLRDEGGRGVMSTPPFARTSVATVWGDGVVTGTQNAFELVRHNPQGDVTGVVRIPGWDLRLTDEDVEAYIQGRLSQTDEERRPGLRSELESMPRPDTRPALGHLLADELGNLWVSEWAIDPDNPEVWTVLDPSGAWLGSLTVPERFSPYVIGGDWVLGVEWDDLDVEYVAMYPLRKN
jgi:hypothetical protein